MSLLSAFESGIALPNDDFWQLLADFYQVPVDWLRTPPIDELQTITSHLSVRLFLLRNQQKISQYDLAAKLNWDPARYVAIETDQAAPNIAEVVQLAREFQTTTDNLLLNLDPLPTTNPANTTAN